MSKYVKNTTFPSLLDLILPHSCRGCGHTGSVLCDRCKKYILAHSANLCPEHKTPISGPSCPNCPDLPPTFTIGPREGLLAMLIHDYKYNSTRAIAPILAALLAERLPAFTAPVVIVPLPTASTHVRARGFDHTALLARHLARLLHARTEHLLIRNKNTVQVGASASARLTQADSAYKTLDGAKFNPSATYILLDDVWTTGASMRAALAKLTSAGLNQDHAILAVLAISPGPADQTKTEP